MIHDNWLARWLPLLEEKSENGDTTTPVLEIGCGHGDDTATLARAGYTVVAFDLSAASVGIAKLRVPSARIECRDIRDPFPDEARQLGAVVASLSLHYFAWDETVSITRRIRDVLRPGGVLLCRLNSTEDRNFGADGHPQIEHNYFMVDGTPKRFFDEPAVRRLFADGWNTLSLQHFTTRKYLKSKSLWEVVLERDG